jgi:AraC-like DNA-binding protein
MLKFSEYTPLDIGNYLNFSSHSHFISCFRKHTGMTPKQYRENYFRMTWQQGGKDGEENEAGGQDQARTAVNSE